MENIKRKPGVGISFLGFLLTIILMLSFLGNGVLWGLKTTVLKGNGIVDVVKNLDASEVVSEIMVQQEPQTMEEEMMVKLVGKVLESETFETTLEQIVDGILTGTKVNFADTKEILIQDIKKIGEESVDEVIQEVKSTPGEINIETLLQNEDINKLQEQTGIAIADMVMEYIEGEYGKTSIATEEVNFDKLKQSVMGVVETQMEPMVDQIADMVVVELNQMVNEEIISENNNEITTSILMAEKILKGITIATLVGIVELVILVILEVLLYKNFRNRAYRNIGIAAIVPGIFILILGAGVQIAKTLIIEFQSQATTASERMVMQFIEKHIASIGTVYLIVGGVFFVGAIVCFVFSKKLKKKAAEVIA